MQIERYISVRENIAHLSLTHEFKVAELLAELRRQTQTKQIGSYTHVEIVGFACYGLNNAEEIKQVISAWARQQQVSVSFSSIGGYRAGTDSLGFIALEGSLKVNATGELVESQGLCFDSIAELAEMSTRALRAHILQSGFSRVHLGLSGGLDSALVATLAVDALGAENVVGILMPSAYSSQGSIDDALELAANLGIKTHTISIVEPLEQFKNSLNPHTHTDGLVEENLQARIRGILLMAYSNAEASILLSTGNKSESAVGYCTLYGDMAGGYAPIADIYKTRAYELAKYLGRIPQTTCTKAPSAELRPDQKDQDSLPPYPVLDRLLASMIEEGKLPEELIASGEDEQLVMRVWTLLTRSSYKRIQATSFCKLSPKTIGEARL